MAERPLDPQVESYRRELDAAGAVPLHRLSVAEAREAELSELGPVSREPVAHVVDRLLPGAEGEVPVRIYLPEAVRPLPVLVYFFGGGWVLGSPEAVDPVCRRLANATPCAVVSVGYRRAPEHPFPAGLEDCYPATRWVAEHGSELGLDPVRLAVGGASAGGNLAAAVALLARERSGPALMFQLLVYPPLDHRADTESMQESLDPVFFGRDDVAWCWSHYLAQPGRRRQSARLAAAGARSLRAPRRARDHSRSRPASRPGRALCRAARRGRRAGGADALREHGARLLLERRPIRRSRRGADAGSFCASTCLRDVDASAGTARGPGSPSRIPTDRDPRRCCSSTSWSSSSRAGKRSILP